MLTHEQIDHNINYVWSLNEYINWLNRDAQYFKLTNDLSHWSEYGITTASDLAEYLDNCVRGEE